MTAATTLTAPLTRALASATLGRTVTVARVGGEPRLARRLAALGIRPGALVTLRHRAAGGGHVVAVGGARIALDRSVLEAVEVADV